MAATSNLERLRQAALRADDKFQEALERKWGGRAGDMRYRPKQYTPTIAKLAAAKLRADELWHRAVTAARATGKSNPASRSAAAAIPCRVIPNGKGGYRVFVTAKEAARLRVGNPSSTDLKALAAKYRQMPYGGALLNVTPDGRVSDGYTAVKFRSKIEANKQLRAAGFHFIPRYGWKLK